MTLALFLFLAVFVRRYKMALLLIIVVLALIFAPILKQISPDGFADRIQSLSPDYYNTIGAPARTWPKYEEEQRYNIGALGNTAVVSTNDKEVVEGPFKKRLLSLMANSGK
jgi:hypothetical protein